MNILQININYSIGSTGNIVRNIENLLQIKGFNSFVAFGRDDYINYNTILIGSKIDVYVHMLGTRLFDKHGLYSQKATKKFIEDVEKLDIDVFHLHNIHGYYLHYPTLFKYLKEKNKPVVWTLHDCWSFTGHCTHYNYIGCDRWQTMCYSCPQKSRYPASYIFDNSKENFLLKKEYFTSLDKLTIVTPSHWLANEVKKSFLKDFDIKVIYNGIDLNIFQPRKSDFRKKFKLDNDFLILGVSGVWTDRKGFNHFLELAKMLKDDEKLVLVGLDDKQLNNLPKNIIGIKKIVNQKELSNIYSAVDVFVNLTLEEVLGLTNIESLACGTPVITFNSGGSPETIDINTGISVDKGNLDKVYEAIQIIKKNRKETYSIHCLNRAKQYFDKDNNFNEYIKLYENLIKE